MRLGGESVLEVSKAQAGGRSSGYASNGQWSTVNVIPTDNSCMFLACCACMIIKVGWTSQWMQLKMIMTKRCMSS